MYGDLTSGPGHKQELPISHAANYSTYRLLTENEAG
jgi:hypothetical protein